MPYQVIYSSESATPMQTDDLEDILESARESNAEAGITGALIYVDGFFLQILEGEAKPVLDLMARITKDVRHEAVTVLKQGEVAAAGFADWKMAYVSATARQVAEWAGLSGTTAVPDILADMHRSPSRVTQVAERILSVLAEEPDSSRSVG
jgi:Sensors of blue-light using FAD